MPETKRCNHLSASSVAAFKKCPQLFRLSYVEGLRLAEDTESQRVGTNWHRIHEEWANTPGDHDTKLTAVITLLNERYTGKIPASKTAEEWDLERTILLVSFIGYIWRWTNDPVEFLASEVPFNLPLMAPKINMPLPMTEVQRVGKIDHIIKWQGAVCALERKSTSRSIAPDSDYWEKSQKDTQVSMYALAFRDMIANGQMADYAGPLPLKEGEPMPRVGNTLYDCWHRPTIRPKELTQKDTAEFLETGKYMEQEFKVKCLLCRVHREKLLLEFRDLRIGRAFAQPSIVEVNGVGTAIIPGKKGFAIRETVEMYGARLLQDIYARPDFYYQRREIARTDAEIAEFKQQLFAVYTAQKAFEKSGCWFECESQCRATYPCAYIPICYSAGGASAVCDGKTTPEGYKRIFSPITLEGKVLEEE
jgi:hypothetical protein